MRLVSRESKFIASVELDFQFLTFVSLTFRKMASRLPSLGCLARILSRQVKWRHTLRPTIGVNHLHVSQELLGNDKVNCNGKSFSG